jgi:DNA-binding transcriptional LysR family regulator
VVSQTLANLEGQLGVKLFDRSGHLPVLTDQGRALLVDARTVAGDVDLLKARAKSLAGGLEPELSMAVDVMFPDDAERSYQEARLGYVRAVAQRYLDTVQLFLALGGTSPSASLGATFSQPPPGRGTAQPRSEPPDVL